MRIHNPLNYFLWAKIFMSADNDDENWGEKKEKFRVLKNWENNKDDDDDAGVRRGKHHQRIIIQHMIHIHIHFLGLMLILNVHKTRYHVKH